MPAHAFTIAKLADAAGVSVETVRYYQSRGLLAQAPGAVGSFRAYAAADVQRLQFIRRAQDLGFALDDIAELMSLSGTRNKRRARGVTQRRLAEIRQRLERLGALADALEGLIERCEHSAPEQACPIIAALTGEPMRAVKAAPSTVQSRSQMSSARKPGARKAAANSKK